MSDKFGPRSKDERLEKEINLREYFTHLNKKYIDTMSKNPVLVMPDQEVETLDRMPRVSMLEDIHFRKALPKSYKLFTKMAPFSDRLDLIRDSKKFISSLSKDMLRTVIGREARHYKDFLEDENIVQEELYQLK